ncbi:MAG: virulence factor family protein [Deltaproteobacteria bacterium]|nr:virulence factor family protein [Deltaproteobacteria bacterium]
MAAVLILTSVPVFYPAGYAADRGKEEALSFAPFGTVKLYRAMEHPSRVVLFVSGDGGWNQGVVDMARRLASLDALVAGIDIRRYMAALEKGAGKCAYPASDFEALSQYLQKKLGFPRYTAPILVGYSSGATLVYAVLVQAPPGTFSGAMSLGFCTDLSMRKLPCRGAGLSWKPGKDGKGVQFDPVKNLPAPWIVFQGLVDQVCIPAETARFVAQVPGGELVNLPKVGHGFSVPSNWLPQFREAFRRFPSGKEPAGALPSSPAVSDLPLVEIPSQGIEGSTIAVIASGAGGWASIDRSLGERFAARGMPVVGLDSLRYFWTPRTPASAGADLARIIRHALAGREGRKVLLVGYSMGAEVLPFMVDALPPDLRAAVRGIALVAPGPTASFEFHVSYWLGGKDVAPRPVLPELRKLRGEKVLCLFGEDETDSLCSTLPAAVGKAIPLRGGHHLGGNYDALADRILEEIGSP